MSDPSDRLGPLARAIVDEGLHADEPSERDRARVRARLAAALGVSTLTAAGAQVAAASSAGAGVAEATALSDAAAASGTAAGALGADAGAIAAAKLGAAANSTGLLGVFTALGGKGLISLVGVAALGAAVATTVVLRQPPTTSLDKPVAAAPAPAAGEHPQPTAAARPALVDQAQHTAAGTHEMAHAEPDTRAVPPVRAGAQTQPPAAARSSTALPKAATRGPRYSAVRSDAPAPQRSVLVPATPEPSAAAADPQLAAAAQPEQAAVAATVAPSSDSEPSPETVAPPTAATVSTDQPVPNTTQRPEPRPVAKAPALSGELKLLAAAQEAIRTQALARALDLLDEHAARFPRGALRPERLAARAVVLCRMSETNAGRAALHRLEAETSDSPLLTWARDACGM